MANWLSVEDVANIIGFHKKTVRRKLREGQIKGYNVGRWRVKESDLEEYITSSRKGD